MLAYSLSDLCIHDVAHDLEANLGTEGLNVVSDASDEFSHRQQAFDSDLLALRLGVILAVLEDSWFSFHRCILLFGFVSATNHS
jgi:hypothetical protein